MFAADRFATLSEVLSGYRARSEVEAVELARIQALLADPGDPWSRSKPLHVTASAMIVHPASRRVLLRWQHRQQAWLHVGGHGDPGEDRPLSVALREAVEETGLPDLRPWPGPGLLHVSVVTVDPSPTEPAHQHGDLQFVLATDDPDAARPETPQAPLRWESVPKAWQLTDRHAFRETLIRVAQLLE